MGERTGYDLAVMGGGSGGFSAALAAARRGLLVLLVEQHAMLGGTSTLGGVNTWEPSVGGPGIPAEIYRRLAGRPATIGVSRTTAFHSRDHPWGFSQLDRTVPYRDTLRRSTWPPEDWRRVTFEPDALAAEMQVMLVETDRVDLRLGARFVGAETKGARITALHIEAAGGREQVRARFVVDATAQLDVCRSAGCETCLGAEPRAMYGEPHAPEEPVDTLNGVTLCYRVTPTDSPSAEPLPEGVRDEPWPAASSVCEYPCGDINVNMLPTMQGAEFHRLAPERARAACQERALRHWHWLQSEYGFDRYRMAHMFPMIGVREGPRLVGRHVLTEREVRAGCSGQANADRFITLCDHALDVHGEGGHCAELDEPYGVPYECLLPGELENLIVACRGASFTHIAASSCRTTRTMMGLGHAAGLAVAAALEGGTQLPDANLNRVRAWIGQEDVALDPEDDRFPPAR